jgi:light-regulated signal transduction histidine kinase (bacteriophytochrome)
MLLQNLISNAVKFRKPDADPRISIGVHQEDDFWHFAVQDNGIGIEPQFEEKIFVIFQRLHPRDVYPGTGIGLAICKRIVEHHGGRIRLDPAYTDGARICFTLPVSA